MKALMAKKRTSAKKSSAPKKNGEAALKASTVRMDESMYDAIDKLAYKEHRSFQGQVLWILDQYFESMRKKKSGEDGSSPDCHNDQSS